MSTDDRDHTREEIVRVLHDAGLVAEWRGDRFTVWSDADKDHDDAIDKVMRVLQEAGIEDVRRERPRKDA